MKISCVDRTIELILTSSAYKIPRFQRPYSWDRSNIDDFWSDLNENPHGYFIGSMVLFEENEREHGLVDGQQRLTTITMLLAALRDELLQLGAEEEARGLHLLIERPQVRTNKLYFILQTDSSYPYLQGRIQAWPEARVNTAAVSKEEKGLELAFAQLTNLVRAITASVNADPSIPENYKKATTVTKLEEIRDKVLDLSVVHIVVDDEDDATVIFQTLNSRGKDLSVADLVRSHLRY